MTSALSRCTNRINMARKIQSRHVYDKPRTLSTAIDLWDRQPGEQERAWLAFLQYRDLPDRNLRKVAEWYQSTYRTKPGAVGAKQFVAYTLVQHLSSRWRWRGRVEAWDREQDRVRRAAHLRGIAEMYERQARDGAGMQGIAKRELAKLGKKCEAVDKPVLSCDQSARLYELGVKTERTARGEPGDVTGTPNDVTVDSRRERLRALIKDDECRKAVEIIARKLDSD